VETSRLLPTFEFANEMERKYFAQFQEKTALDIAPYFDSETWRRLVSHSSFKASALSHFLRFTVLISLKVVQNCHFRQFDMR
jgi:hypothetical protein